MIKHQMIKIEKKCYTRFGKMLMHIKAFLISLVYTVEYEEVYSDRWNGNLTAECANQNFGITNRS